MNIQIFCREWRREKKNFIDENDSKPMNTIVVRTRRHSLALEELLILNSNEWFSSDIINVYLNIALTSPNIDSEINSFFVFDVYFYQRLPLPSQYLLDSRILNGHSLGTLRFENCSKIFIPVNFGNRHWLAVKIDKTSCLISVLDSKNPHKNRANYHDEDLEDKIRSFLNCNIPSAQFEPSKYSFEYKDVVQQYDGSNCGSFTILNILNEIGLIHFQIQNDSGFFRDLKLIFFHELINYPDLGEMNDSSFILNML